VEGVVEQVLALLEPQAVLEEVVKVVEEELLPQEQETG